MRFTVLASGSGGNACYVETEKASLMVDAGLSCRELINRLEGLDVNPKGIDALIITHEHTDHMRGAGPLARRLKIPVYSNPSIFRKGMNTLGNLSKPVPINTGQTITLKDVVIETFTKCHDSVDPMGLVVSSDGARLGIVTDMGRSTRLVEDRLRGCHALIIEFNYDPKMLEDGPYPLEVKRRIKGQDGHLSNQQAGKLLKAVSHNDLAFVVLSHLSEVNNSPEKAIGIARRALKQGGCRDTKILVSEQHSPVALIDLS